jgi:hypothetical protein
VGTHIDACGACRFRLPIAMRDTVAWCAVEVDPVSIALRLTPARFGTYSRDAAECTEWPMPLDDELVAVYFGEDTDSLFLKTLLEGSGIPASLRNFSMSGGGGADVRVFVARRDVERAQPSVEDFKNRGQKSPE